ncbi:hypothetical protein POTOM_017913 [Populus tomentosa]|uniref:Uncharacterized protein n=1 Tax=Populus tomentosa TaxID=118781 RepID=A0A8X8A565_POPTO|nr:hypothetical protein POTOM_017913 [Populus tomentosa]
MISIFPHSVIGRELDKQDDHFLFDTSIQGEVEACQILEDTSFPISELDTPSNLQVIVEDGPINYALGASAETKHHSAPGTGLSGQTKSKRQPWEEQGSGKDSRRKERSKFRTEDTINEKMHSNIVYEKNMPKCFNPGTLLKMILHLFCQMLATTDTIR